MHVAEQKALQIYLSPDGNDKWSGLIPKRNKANTDGPLRTLEGFRNLLRMMKEGRSYHPSRQRVGECLSEPLAVCLRGGTYPLKSAVVFGAEDSWPITFMPYPGEKAVISGGERIKGWRTTNINGRAAWVTELPEVAQGRWYFRQLFVNGRRAQRPRFPKRGLLRMKEVPGMSLPAWWGGGGQTRFVCNPGEGRPFRNIEDVEAVYLHWWIEERSGLSSFDPATNTITMKRPSHSALVGQNGSQLADYYLDNVFEELNEPGQWYLDRPKGALYYIPLRGETMAEAEVIAPRCLQLIVLAGCPNENRYVEHIRFSGLCFAHTDWRHPDPSDGCALEGPDGCFTSRTGRLQRRGIKAGTSQAACDVPGVIHFKGARHCAIENCAIEHIGWHGIEIAEACSGIRVCGCTVRDTGGGAVKINGAAARDHDVKTMQTGHIVVADNEIAHCGRIFHSSVGVLSMNAHNVAICHNHIHDIFYSGISCGWEWGYQENISRDNLIAFNHIHDIGQKMLSDMGGIYTLGVQPGTVLRNNLIYNVSSAHYGGWCIYTDEGSSHILIENNVCFDADREPFHQHYGRENIVRNNIWAFGGEGVAVYSRLEPHRGCMFLRNIMVSKGEAIFVSRYPPEAEAGRIFSDVNVFYSVKGKPYFKVGGKKLTMRQWQALGHDIHSITANPRFRNIAKRDFRLPANSPALKLGFVPIDLSRVGPRKPSCR